MKKQFLCLIAVSAICSILVNAQVRTPNSISVNNVPPNIKPVKIFPTDLQLVNLQEVNSIKNNALQSLAFTNRFFANDYAANTFFAQDSKPFVYEPISNTLAILYNKNVNTGSGIIDSLFYFYSTNGGASWNSNASLLTVVNDFVLSPQLGLGNTNSSTLFKDLSFISYTKRVSLKQPINRYFPDGGTLIYKNGSDIINISDGANLYGPKTNNSPGYGWGDGSLHKYHNTTGDGVVLAGTLSPKYNGDGSASIQYGQYGVFSTKSIIEDDNDIIGTIPQTWSNSQFLASTAIGSTYNGPMYTGSDNQGNIYACTNSVFADDKDNRTVAFTKSTDRGATWTTFVRAPANIFETYGKSRGGENSIIFRPYQQAAFVVTGVDKFSYFTRMYVVKGTDNQIVGLDIVEISYDNSNWSIQQVSPFNGTPSVYSIEIDSIEAHGYDKVYATEDESRLGNELEAALTTDGNSIILKWIDYNTDLGPIVLSPAQAVYEQDDKGQMTGNIIEIDTMFATDIYLSTRKLNSSTWTTPNNLTNDVNFDKGTKMPEYVPSIENIPLMAVRSLAKSDWNTNNIGTLLKNSPEVFVSAIIDLPFRVATTKMAAIVGVEESTENTTSTFTMSSIAPNPVADNAEVSFNTSISGIAQLNVVNTLGEKVMNVYEGAIQPGVHGFNIDSANLPSGSYIVSLTINGKTQTRTLNVIH